MAKKSDATTTHRGSPQKLIIPELTVGGKKVTGVIVQYEVKKSAVAKESAEIIYVKIPAKGKRFIPQFAPPQEAEQRISAVTQKATELLGSENEALRWLGTPVRALNFATPISLLGTKDGADSVCDILGQMEHGIW